MSSKISIKMKREEVKILTVGDLAVGSVFLLKDKDVLYLKSDEWSGQTLRCTVLNSGVLAFVGKDSLVDRVFSKVTISVE